MREEKPLGRPRAFDEDTALEQIMAVFWAKGFEGASMSDLMAATGLKKGSLYAAFGDKRAMYSKALALYDRTRIDRAVEDLQAGGAPRATVERFLQTAIAEGQARGCFLCNASVDQAPIDSTAGRLVRASLGRLEAALAAALRPSLGRRGAARQARHLMSVYFGLRVLAKAGTAPETLADVKRAALASLTSTSPRARAGPA